MMTIMGFVRLGDHSPTHGWSKKKAKEKAWHAA